MTMAAGYYMCPTTNKTSSGIFFGELKSAAIIDEWQTTGTKMLLVKPLTRHHFIYSNQCPYYLLLVVTMGERALPEKTCSMP